jgi:hypothetical protein
MGWYLVGSTSWLLQLLEATEAELQGHGAWPLSLRDPRALGGQALAAGGWGRDGRGGGGAQPPVGPNRRPPVSINRTGLISYW